MIMIVLLDLRRHDWGTAPGCVLYHRSAQKHKCMHKVTTNRLIHDLALLAADPALAPFLAAGADSATAGSATSAAGACPRDPNPSSSAAEISAGSGSAS
jgi:hypothetical protein